MSRHLIAKNAFWPSPALLAASLPQGSGTHNICYELAPTGALHAGIVRTLLFGQRIIRECDENGLSAKFLIRINDLAPQKPMQRTIASIQGLYSAASQPSWRKNHRSALEQLKSEIADVCHRLRLNVSEIILVSDIYRSTKFRTFLARSLEHSFAIEDKLASLKSSPVQLFFPYCPSCSRIHSSAPSRHSSINSTTYKCCVCQTTYHYNPLANKSLITFKLELALIWQSLNVSIDLHGQDHAEAFHAALTICDLCGFNVKPAPGRVNSSFNGQRKKLSKSQFNSKPVVDFTSVDMECLFDLVNRTPYWKPMYLPKTLCGAS